jgi:hypothetical protein
MTIAALRYSPWLLLTWCITPLTAAGQVAWHGDLFRDRAAGQGRIQPAIEPFGAEDFGGQGRKPRIAEPMVFDLVRPLGAQRGELEVNSLALFPMHRTIGKPTGQTHPIDWAPEIELAIADGLALEFELPFEDDRLQEYKLAWQYTFGTALEERFVHGLQNIIVYDRESGNVVPTLLYLFAFRIDDYWSMLHMVGLRTEIGGDDRAARTEQLVNLNLFRDVSDAVTLGLETNYAQQLGGPFELLVMPQMHWEMTDHWMLQAGVGMQFTERFSLPLAGMRLIWSY